ncbi:hypothetical protein GYB62_01445 [bacterium]|nr:hypothetical protein [bacterium]
MHRLRAIGCQVGLCVMIDCSGAAWSPNYVESLAQGVLLDMRNLALIAL